MIACIVCQQEIRRGDLVVEVRSMVDHTIGMLPLIPDHLVHLRCVS